MGGTTSKTTLEVLTDIATNVAADSLLTCTNIATQSQILTFSRIKGDITLQGIELSQGTAVDIKCAMDATKQAEIASKVAEAIIQTAESKGEAVLSVLGNTKSDAISKLTSKFTNKISADTTTELKMLIGQNEEIAIDDVSGNVIMTNITMSQSSLAVASALMKTQTYSSVISETATTIDQHTKTEEKNPLAELIQSIFQAPILLLAGIVLGVILLIILVRFAFSSSSFISSSTVSSVSSISPKKR